jgi:RNA recognition motif-containing protein
LEDAFGTFGKITKVVIVYDARSQQSRGFGFITFDSVEDASKAKEAMNGSVFIID